MFYKSQLIYPVRAVAAVAIDTKGFKNHQKAFQNEGRRKLKKKLSENFSENTTKSSSKKQKESRK